MNVCACRFSGMSIVLIWWMSVPVGSVGCQSGSMWCVWGPLGHKPSCPWVPGWVLCQGHKTLQQSLPTRPDDDSHHCTNRSTPGIREIVRLPQWLLQSQSQWPMEISHWILPYSNCGKEKLQNSVFKFYPIKPKFLQKIWRKSLSVKTSQQTERS